MSDQNEENFRQSMRRLAATVCVISCQHEGVRYGITVTSVTSLCFKPLSILVCINKGTSIINPLLAQGRYCINVLQKSQVEILKALQRRRPGGRAFPRRRMVGNAEGVPYLPDAQANLFCEVDQTVAYSTHQIVIGRATAAAFAECVDPLIYQNGGYVACAPLLLHDAA
jgi:flavin reductase (DIM6/NTAB) family NADH-FMN oxidoreductase RutF